MAMTVAKVPANAVVAWNILALVLRMEGEILKPDLERIINELKVLREELNAAIQALEAIQAKAEPVLEHFDAETLWEDRYTLCGNQRCAGDCTICLQGEEDYEDDHEEKYCRRGRR